MAIPQLNQYNDLREEVARRYEQLHPDLKAALVSVDTAGAVYEIGKKFGLNIEKTGYLADVIGYTIIGLLPVADFISNLKDTLGIDGTKAEEISREVNAKIFLAIREQLKKTHGEKWDERAMTRESGIKNKELRITETPKTAPPTPAEPERAAPKSPWEIKPDGLTQETGNKGHGTWGKSVIPPIPVLSIKEQVLRTETAKAAEAEVKKVVPIPPELPKTREAPQPAPIMRGPGVLREITPSRIDVSENRPEVSITKPVLRAETAKTVPPENLPFAQEVKTLTQTPELEKLQQPPIEADITKQVLRDETKKTEVSITKPVLPDETKQPPTKIPEKHYEADPYREPIE